MALASICRGELPVSGCFYYVSWDAYVILGDDWVNVYGGGYSVAGGSWMRLGEANIYPPSLEAQGYKTEIYDYYRSFDSLKLNPENGGGYTLAGYGGMWGRAEGEKKAEPDESFFYYIWSPEEGKVTTADIRFQLGGPPEHWNDAQRAYYTNFGSRCGGLPDFTTTSCDPPIYLGTAAPPPPPGSKKMCCDCNTIASIFAENTAAEAKQHEATRNLIDRRAIEELQQINKMLQGMQIKLNLQPVIDRIDRVEANLWNGLGRQG